MKTDSVLFPLPYLLTLLYPLVNIYGYFVLGTESSLLNPLVYGSAALYFVIRFTKLIEYGFFISKGELSILLLCLTLLLCFIAQNIFQNVQYSSLGISSNNYALNLAIANGIWLFAGGACSFYQRKPSYLLSALITIPIFSIVYMTVDESFMIDYSTLGMDEEDRISHLIISDFLLINLLFSYTLAGNLRLIILFAIVAIMFPLGGRTELYLAIVAIVTYELIYYRNEYLIKLLVAGVICVGMVYFLSSEEYIDITNQSVKEMLFLEGVSEDSSYIARNELEERGFANLPKTFWIGNPGLLANYGKDDMGGYIHNLLSVWQFFGFFTFSLFILLLISSFRRMRATLKSTSDCTKYSAAIMLIYVMIAVVVSKAITLKLLWFIIGYWMLSYESPRKSIKPKSSRRRRKPKRRRKRKSPDPAMETRLT